MAPSGILCVDEILNKAFNRLGIFIAKRPGYFIIVPILLSILCMTGYQQIEYEIDPEYLFAPINGRGQVERAIVEEFFKVNYTHHFNVERITRPGRFGRVIVTSRDRNNDTMLRREIFEELRRLDEIIQNATVVIESESFTYRDICAKWLGSCFVNDILNLDYLLDDIESGQLNLTFPIMFNPITWDTHILPMFFGGTQRNDDDTIVLSVPALQLVYFAAVGNKQLDERADEWEEIFLNILRNTEKSDSFKYISISYFGSKTLDIEMEKNTKTIIPYYGSTFLMMALFSIITCMMGDSVRSKPLLGFMGNISAAMGTLSAFGFAMYMGIEFIGINLVIPFLIIGIGIDDTFVMLAAWRQTNHKLSVVQRMGQTMSNAAISITITSLTDVISFVIGILSPFRSVRIFCIYSSLAIGFTFFFHITFFAACMAISGYREEKNLHCLFGCRVKSLSLAIQEKRNFFYKMIMSGGVNRTDPDNPIDNREHLMMAFFKNHLANLINNKWWKCLILLTFVVYICGGCYGITQINEGLDRRKLAPIDSYSIEFFNREDDYYREFPYRIQLIIAGELNYSDPMIQLQIENLTNTLERTSYVTSPLYTESWLRSFLSFIEYNGDQLNVSNNSLDEDHFVAVVKHKWLSAGNPFSLDVKFNENGTRILASRFLIQAVNITDTNHEKEMVRDLRQICSESPLNASIFHPYFVFFDQFELVRPTSLQAMVVGAIIMMIISFIFIPNILCSLWVAISVISIELGVAGYMALWDVNLDSISMINLIMCIGFSVDFTAHICYTYMSSKKKYPSARVREALYSLGLPILQGSSSTILGVMALLLAQSYIFLVFFKMVFLVIFFGAMHGLFLLPVLLSLFGPGSMQTWKGTDYGSDEDIDLDAGVDVNKKKISQTDSVPFYLSYPYSSTSKRFGSIYKAYRDEKDLGIGTSGEDSVDSCSNLSPLHQTMEEENLRNRYENTWRELSLKGSLSQFQPIPDFYGQPKVHRLQNQQHQQQSKMQRHLSLGDLIYMERHAIADDHLLMNSSRKYRPNPNASSTAKRCKKRNNILQHQQMIPRVDYRFGYSYPYVPPFYAMPRDHIRPTTARSATNLNFYCMQPPHYGKYYN